MHFFYGRDRDADLIFAGDIAGDDNAGASEIHGELRHVEAGLARILGQPFRHVTLVFHAFGNGHFVEEGAAQAVGEPGDKEGMADAGGEIFTVAEQKRRVEPERVGSFVAGGGHFAFGFVLPEIRLVHGHIVGRAFQQGIGRHGTELFARVPVDGDARAESCFYRPGQHHGLFLGVLALPTITGLSFLHHLHDDGGNFLLGIVQKGQPGFAKSFKMVAHGAYPDGYGCYQRFLGRRFCLK